LKRKKERRKHKAKPTLQDHPDSDEEDGDIVEDILGIEEFSGDNEPNEDSDIHKIQPPVKRPKKRPRLAEDVREEKAEMDLDEETVKQEVRAETQKLVGALPSFPLPALPNAPSKSLLALQGLDQALLDAELVSSNTVFAIPQGEDDGGTRLSERIRKRLCDIGITELFAGMFYRLEVQERILIFF